MLIKNPPSIDSTHPTSRLNSASTSHAAPAPAVDPFVLDLMNRRQMQAERKYLETAQFAPRDAKEVIHQLLSPGFLERFRALPDNALVGEVGPGVKSTFFEHLHQTEPDAERLRLVAIDPAKPLDDVPVTRGKGALPIDPSKMSAYEYWRVGVDKLSGTQIKKEHGEKFHALVDVVAYLSYATVPFNSALANELRLLCPGGTLDACLSAGPGIKVVGPHGHDMMQEYLGAIEGAELEFIDYEAFRLRRTDQPLRLDPLRLVSYKKSHTNTRGIVQPQVKYCWD